MGSLSHDKGEVLSLSESPMVPCFAGTAGPISVRNLLDGLLGPLPARADHNYHFTAAREYIEKALVYFERSQGGGPERLIGPDTCECPNERMAMLTDVLIGLCDPVAIYRRQVAEHCEHLIVVLPRNCNKKFGEYHALFNVHTKSGHDIHYSFYKMQQVARAIDNGSIFHLDNCKKDHLIYYDGSEPFPDPSLTVDEKDEIGRASLQGLEISHHKCKAFINGALHFYRNESGGMALFLMHQSLETALRSLLYAIARLEVRSHSLTALMAQCKRLLPHLLRACAEIDNMDAAHWELLEGAYLDARYAHDFQVSVNQVAYLVFHVERLVSKMFSVGRFAISEFVAKPVS